MVEGKPDLLAVLRHYGIDARDGRVEQLVCCPVHSESRPSCSVNVLKGLWNCKACSAQGDSLTLIQTKEGLSDFAEVVAFAEANFGYVHERQPTGRRGLSGSSRPAGGGGYRPSFKRRGLGD